MESKMPVIEKSRNVEDLQHMRLMALLSELVRDKGPRRAAQEMDVDHRTLTSSLESGRLSRRMQVALEKALLAGGGSPALEQRERNDRLEGRLKDVERQVKSLGSEVSKGLGAVQGDVKALREEHSQGMRRLSQLEAGGRDGQDGHEATGSGGQPGRRTVLWREFPELVTLDPAEDDEETFGDAWPLIVEWRKLKAAHPNDGKGLDWLRSEERFLTVELSLLEDHGLTLPPETYPLRGFARSGQVNWRRTALSDTRRALARRELLHRIGRVLTPGFWRR